MGLEKVTYGGFTEDVESIWASHHALVLPSRSEGLPLVVVEAMLCGRPAIVTDVAGNAELIQDGVSGFVAAAAAPQMPRRSDGAGVAAAVGVAGDRPGGGAGGFGSWFRVTRWKRSSRHCSP